MIFLRSRISNSVSTMYNFNKLYNILFGSDALLFYIGELMLSMLISLDKDKPVELIKFKQKKNSKKKFKIIFLKFNRLSCFCQNKTHLKVRNINNHWHIIFILINQLFLL